MANHQRDPAKEAYWREVIKRQALSGLSMREFCRREGVARRRCMPGGGRFRAEMASPLGRGTGFSLDRWLGQKSANQTFPQTEQGFDAGQYGDSQLHSAHVVPLGQQQISVDGSMLNGPSAFNLRNG